MTDVVERVRIPALSRSTPPSEVGTRRPLRLPTAWPLLVLFAGYPLWWVVGISNFMPLIVAIPMAAELLRMRRPVIAPRGTGIWLLFLGWVGVGVLVLQVRAPGAVPGHSDARYLTFGYRILWYVAATVVLLYVVNLRKTLSLHRVAQVASYMFLVVVAGGLLGVALPTLQFPSLLELVLPGSLTDGGFIHSLIHPTTSQIQDFLGYAQGRPSAPFAYTNNWGLNYAVFLPFFVVAWFRRDHPWQRVAGTVILLLSLVPVVASLNRGLWLALIGAAVLLSVRAALMGRISLLAGVALAGVLASAVLVLTPLGTLVLDRLNNGDSNTGRTNLGTQSFLSTVEGSPVVGFGSTRDPLGNWNSIAAGATADCPRCSPPPLGTQGHLWLVMFSEGLAGLLLYCWFFAGQLVRNVFCGSRYATAGTAVIVMHFITLPFYNAVDVSLFGIMIGVAMLWRAGAEEAGPAIAVHAGPGGTAGRRTTADPELGSYFRLVHDHWLALLLLAAFGTATGLGLQALDGTDTRATQSVLVRPSYGQGLPGSDDFTLDTEGQLVTSTKVVAAVQRVLGPGTSVDDVTNAISLTVEPNSRILNILVAYPNSDKATGAAVTAANAYLSVRSDLLSESRARQLAALSKRSELLTKEFAGARSALIGAGQSANKQLRKAVVRLTHQSRTVSNSAGQLQSTAIDPGSLLGAPLVRQDRDGWAIRAASGFALGALAGVMLCWTFSGTRTRLSTGLRRGGRRPLPVVARVHVPARTRAAAADETLTEARQALASYAPVGGVLAADDSDVSRWVAAVLDEDAAGMQGPTSSPRVLLVACPKSRAQEVYQLHSSLQTARAEVVGLVLASS